MNAESVTRLKAYWREWRTVIIFLIVMILFRSAIADWNQVPSGSMKPTILEGDRVIVNKLAYDLKLPFTTWPLMQWNEPRAGEIVTFYSPRDDRLLIKRVIGVPGDTISMTNNRLYVNGQPATYRRLDSDIVDQLDAYHRTHHLFFYEQFGGIDHPVMIASDDVPLRRPGPANDYHSFGPVLVPRGHYMMLGDNRDHSSDSRVIGLISRDRITGRAHTVAFSVDYDDYYLPRKDRFVRPLQ